MSNKIMIELDENLYQTLCELVHYSDDKFKVFKYYYKLGLISGSIDKIEKTCWVEDYLKWKEYETTYEYNRKRIACDSGSRLRKGLIPARRLRL